MKIFLLILILFFNSRTDKLTSALKALDSGNKKEAELILRQMQKSAPDAPETLLLDALLNENAEEAKAVYEFLYEEYPNFKYADLCLYRLYSYNYAIGNYITANKYLSKLKKEFPNSPYAKAENALPKITKEQTAQENTTTNKTAYKYTIQTGAFSNPNNAHALAEKIKAKGYSVEVVKKVVGNSIFNIVKVGEFKTMERAKVVSQKISEEFNLKTRVIKYAK